MKKIKPRAMFIVPSFFAIIALVGGCVGCGALTAMGNANIESYYRISTKTQNTPDFSIYGCLIWFHNGHQITINFHTAKPYTRFKVRELSFERNGKKYYFVKDKNIRIPGGMKWIDNKYYESGGFYQHDAPFFPHFGACIIGVINKETLKAFDDMERGEEIEIIVTETYSFDDEPYKTIETVYEVRRLFEYELGQT
ncbi:MAG: hypothetical protein LBQ46_12800 [Treponema sp.]|jgi:hypothetical protein|nr:hypothetical protein [Treponema sp.]